MKKKLCILLSSFQLLVLMSVEAQTQNNIPPPVSSVFPNCVFYEIFVRSFYDSNSDSIGDINGITEKLDYLQTLGVQGLWITPIHPSPSYHKYNVTDYYDIDKEYGTLKDFKNLIKEAHKRNIRVLMDMVINHCSRHHDWFIKASANPKSEYRNFFMWKDANKITTDKEHWYVIRDNKAYNLVTTEKFGQGEQAYYGFFSSEMPDLNYDNPKVRSEMIKVGKFWFRETDVDGFRLDAAKWIYQPGNEEKNYSWWREYTAALRKVKPDAFFVGEITDGYKQTAPYLKNALTSVFNFDLGFTIIPSLKNEKDSGIVELLKKSRTLYREASPTFVDATFLTNHDQNRIGSELGGNVRQMKLAAAILLTLPGSPFIYYGEEIGMLGTKPDENIREPFLWNMSDKDPNRCKWMTRKFSTDKTVVPLALQMKSDNSLYSHYQKLIELRNTNEILNGSEIEAADFHDKGLLAYARGSGNASLLVVHNLTGGMIKVDLSLLKKKYATIIYSSKFDTERKDAIIELKPYGSVIVQ